MICRSENCLLIHPRDIIIVVATLAISTVFGSCHNVRETVEEAAVHADVSYELKDSEKEIIRATNDFSFKHN